MKKYWIYCFTILLAADTLALAFNWTTGHFFLKFSLMPVLMIGLLQDKRNQQEKNWRVVLAGLVTAWAGDVLLLFSSDTPIFFIFGLVCFLVTHLAYIVYFSRYHPGIRQRFRQSPVVIGVILVYSVLLLVIIWNGLGDLLIPVILYTIIISLMAIQVWSAYPFLPKNTGNLFVAGAAAFILSDSLLAIDKFRHSFFLANAAIIFTYGIAQLLIVYGTSQNSDLKDAQVDDQLI